jgi:hypothetical protein
MKMIKRIISGVVLGAFLSSASAEEMPRNASRYLPGGRYMLTLAIEGRNLTSVDGKITWQPDGDGFKFDSAEPSAISVTFRVAPWDNGKGGLSGFELTGVSLGTDADRSFLLTGRYFFPPGGKPKMPPPSTQGLGACKVAGFSSDHSKEREVVSGRWALIAIK